MFYATRSSERLIMLGRYNRPILTLDIILKKKTYFGFLGQTNDSFFPFQSDDEEVTYCISKLKNRKWVGNDVYKTIEERNSIVFAHNAQDWHRIIQNRRRWYPKQRKHGEFKLTLDEYFFF